LSSSGSEPSKNLAMMVFLLKKYVHSFHTFYSFFNCLSFDTDSANMSYMDTH
jgi:hypothetical protein